MLRIGTREKGQIMEVTLEGRLDGHTYGELEESFEEILEMRPTQVQLDMSGLEYISSMGLRVIIKALKAMKQNGGDLVMADMQPAVAKVFEIAQALPPQSVFASIEEADEYFDTIQKRVKGEA